MSENLRSFVRALYAFDAVVQRTVDDQWSNPSPCEGWTAIDVLQHQCGVLNGVQRVADTGAMAGPKAPDDMADPQAVWAETRDRLLATLDRQGVLRQQGPFWFDAPTVDDMIGIVKWDLVSHSWDLAKATDQAHGIAADLAEATLETVTPMLGMLTETERIGAAVEVGADADAMDRYLGAIGRDPAWKRPA